MAIKFDEFLAALRTIAPRELEEDWDNGGMQIEMSGGEVRKVLVALEITNGVIDEAIKLGVDYIVSHHPLIFNKIDVIDADTVTGNYIIRLIKNGISVYSAHTSFDKVFGGNNDYLADLLGLQRVRRLKVSTALGDEEMVGRLGVFDPPRSLREIAELVEDALELNAVKVVGDPDTKIEEVGICTGSGGHSIEGVLRNNCDLYITGDLKYHDAQAAKEMGLCIIDAGHYGTEKTFAENFGEKLKKAMGDKIEVFKSNINVDPFALCYNK
ncbi:MAG: Nif3-like dinuclear metal center hexameric protein [Anaerovoracaceae bacterium]|jgi:dinuclear metal center YbgI/SA1388 family protein